MALFIALRIQAGLAANIKPSSTNRMPKPMRKSANAMDLIGLEPPVVLFLSGRRAAGPAALVELTASPAARAPSCRTGYQQTGRHPGPAAAGSGYHSHGARSHRPS